MNNCFSQEELNCKINNGEYHEGDRIYCNEFPNLIFIFEKKEFIVYYCEGHDLYSDGPLKELIKEKKEYMFSNEPFKISQKDLF